MSSDPRDFFIREAEKKMKRYWNRGNMMAYLVTRKKRDRLVVEKEEHDAK